MYADYTDILRRVPVAPQWWDHNGVPRFDAYRPEDSPNPYAEESVLLEVVCPVCGAKFQGEVNSGPFRGRRVLSALAVEGELGYPSPPRHDCQGDAQAGLTVRVVEFWRRGDLMAWERVRGLEGHTSSS